MRKYPRRYRVALGIAVGVLLFLGGTWALLSWSAPHIYRVMRARQYLTWRRAVNQGHLSEDELRKDLGDEYPTYREYVDPKNPLDPNRPLPWYEEPVGHPVDYLDPGLQDTLPNAPPPSALRSPQR